MEDILQRRGHLGSLVTIFRLKVQGTKDTHDDGAEEKRGLILGMQFIVYCLLAGGVGHCESDYHERSRFTDKKALASLRFPMNSRSRAF
jgi:hypothetical protein